MSRIKKSRSMKRVTGGVKTGSKERMKLETKQRKAKKKAANPRKVNRNRSVYQKYLDENNLVEQQHVQAPANAEIETGPIADKKADEVKPAKEKDSLWDQLEKPTDNDIF